MTVAALGGAAALTRALLIWGFGKAHLSVPALVASAIAGGAVGVGFIAVGEKRRSLTALASSLLIGLAGSAVIFLLSARMGLSFWIGAPLLAAAIAAPFGLTVRPTRVR